MRISLIVAILAALGAGVFGYIEVTQQIPQLEQQRDTERNDKRTALNQLASTTRTLNETKDTLSRTQQQLTQAEDAQKKAMADLAAQTKIADDLKDKLTKTSADLETAQASLAAYKATGKSPQEVLQLVNAIRQDQDTITAINDEKKVLNRKLLSVQNQLNELIGVTNYVVRLPADLKGKVVAVDPKWQFVVLNIGDDQGVLQDGQLLISRDAKLVAKVIVRTVYKDSCIANVMPDWKLGEIFEGDAATPAHPAS